MAGGWENQPRELDLGKIVKSRSGEKFPGGDEPSRVGPTILVFR